jgi:uncharacterized membrane protein (UPF0127 family)
MSRTHFLQPLLRRSAAPHGLWNTRTGGAVAERLETAFDSASRKKGLLGREGLPPGVGLVIAPTNLVHTFAMRFAIDILFVSREGRVLKVRHAVPKRRIAGAWGGFAVIEMAAGSLERSDTRPGDQLELRQG